MNEIVQRVAKTLCDEWDRSFNHEDPESFERLARAAIAVMSPQQEWQPIETAPRDGTWFEICRIGEGYDSYEMGRYDPYRVCEYHPVGEGLFRREEKIIHEWRGFNNMHRATHWRLAPEPPK